MEHFKRKLPILNSLPLIGYNWIATHHKRIDRNNLPKNASEYMNFLKMLSDQEIRWVLDWTDCFKPAMHAKASKFIPLLGTQGIMAYTPKIFLRQLGHVQELPPLSDLAEFIISFDNGVRSSQIPLKILVSEAWRTLSDDECITYIPKLK